MSYMEQVRTFLHTTFDSYCSKTDTEIISANNHSEISSNIMSNERESEIDSNEALASLIPPELDFQHFLAHYLIKLPIKICRKVHLKLITLLEQHINLSKKCTDQ